MSAKHAAPIVADILGAGVAVLALVFTATGQMDLKDGGMYIALGVGVLLK